MCGYRTVVAADGSKSQEYYDCGSTSCPDSDYYDPDEDSKG